MSVAPPPVGYGPNENPVVGSVPGDPLESEFIQEAQGCIRECQRWHPEYWRTTLDANSYRACLSRCSGLPVDTYENWPADLIRTAGQDVVTYVAPVVRSAQGSLLLIVLGLAAVAFIVYRVK